MKINPINKHNTFKGLWGNTDTKTFNHKYISYFDDTAHYYPFADESPEEIQKLKSQYPKRSSGCYSLVFPIWAYETVTTIFVDKKLPFMKAEWAEYSKNFSKIGSNLKNHVEEGLKKLNLQKHILR